MCLENASRRDFAVATCSLSWRCNERARAPASEFLSLNFCFALSISFRNCRCLSFDAFSRICGTNGIATSCEPTVSELSGFVKQLLGSFRCECGVDVVFGLKVLFGQAKLFRTLFDLTLLGTKSKINGTRRVRDCVYVVVGNVLSQNQLTGVLSRPWPWRPQTRVQIDSLQGHASDLLNMFPTCWTCSKPSWRMATF